MLELPVEDAVLHFVGGAGWLLGIPLPSLMLPRSCTRVSAVDGVFHFDVGLYALLSGGLIVRYRGCLKPDAAEARRAAPARRRGTRRSAGGRRG